MKQVQKLDMAVEQLEDALKAYFDERFHSAIVLAGAAEELFAGYVMKHGMKPAWSPMDWNNARPGGLGRLPKTTLASS